MLMMGLDKEQISKWKNGYHVSKLQLDTKSSWITHKMVVGAGLTRTAQSSMTITKFINFFLPVSFQICISFMTKSITKITKI